MNEFPWYMLGAVALSGACAALVFALGIWLIVVGVWYVGIPLIGALFGVAGCLLHYFIVDVD